MAVPFVDRPPRIVCLGLTAQDVTWNVSSLPSGSGKTRATDLHQGGGGMAATAAVAIARLGASVQFWGRAGDDAAGHAMHAELAGYGVDVSQFRLFSGARSSVSGIVVDAQGERMVVNFRGEGLPADPQWLPLATVAACDAVLADPRWPEGSLALFQAARSAGVVSVLDADVADNDVFDRLLPWADHAVFSEPALHSYAGSDIETALARARQRGARTAAVTLGERGVCWLDDTGLHRLPSFAVQVVDTNGAGDVFHGALAFALAQGQDTTEAYRFSAAVAALKCTRAGGRGGVPDLASALAFLHQHKD